MFYATIKTWGRASELCPPPLLSLLSGNFQTSVSHKPPPPGAELSDQGEVHCSSRSTVAWIKQATLLSSVEQWSQCLLSRLSNLGGKSLAPNLKLYPLNFGPPSAIGLSWSLSLSRCLPIYPQLPFPGTWFKCSCGWLYRPSDKPFNDHIKPVEQGKNFRLHWDSEYFLGSLEILWAS